jgi:hypothetical protein
MSLDLADLKRRAQGTESVGVSNAVLFKLVELAEIGASVGEWFRMLNALARPPVVSAERDPSDPHRMNIRVDAWCSPILPDTISLSLEKAPAAVDDDPEDNVPCITCGRAECVCGVFSDDNDDAVDDQENRA